MARVTVEDCVDKVPNRFDLVLLAAQRAREISGGSELTVDRDRDKNPVVALREVAEQTIKPKELTESVITGLQKILPDDEDEADEVGSLSQSAEALRITASAPTRSACCMNRTPSTVLLEPAPAITGTRPSAARTTSSMTVSCSSWLSVGLSPVVPTGTRPDEPSEICQSTIDLSASRSNFPSENGVTSAGIEP